MPPSRIPPINHERHNMLIKHMKINQFHEGDNLSRAADLHATPGGSVAPYEHTRKHKNESETELVLA